MSVGHRIGNAILTPTISFFFMILVVLVLSMDLSFWTMAFWVLAVSLLSAVLEIWWERWNTGLAARDAKRQKQYNEDDDVWEP